MKLTARQMDCLCSPARVSLYETIQLRGPASAAELAGLLKRSVHSLYYHLRALREVGLIRVADYRRSGKRDEAVFEVVSKRLVFDRNQTNRAYQVGLIKTVRVALRNAEKEHSCARENEASPELFGVARIKARLLPEDTLRLRKEIERLGRWVRNHHRDEGDEVSLTCLSVPIGEGSD